MTIAQCQFIDIDGTRCASYGTKAEPLPGARQLPVWCSTHLQQAEKYALAIREQIKAKPTAAHETTRTVSITPTDPARYIPIHSIEHEPAGEILSTGCAVLGCQITYQPASGQCSHEPDLTRLVPYGTYRDGPANTNQQQVAYCKHCGQLLERFRSTTPALDGGCSEWGQWQLDPEQPEPPATSSVQAQEHPTPVPGAGGIAKSSVQAQEHPTPPGAGDIAKSPTASEKEETTEAVPAHDSQQKEHTHEPEGDAWTQVRAGSRSRKSTCLFPHCRLPITSRDKAALGQPADWSLWRAEAIEGVDPAWREAVLARAAGRLPLQNRIVAEKRQLQDERAAAAQAYRRSGRPRHSTTQERYHRALGNALANADYFTAEVLYDLWLRATSAEEGLAGTAKTRAEAALAARTASDLITCSARMVHPTPEDRRHLPFGVPWHPTTQTARCRYCGARIARSRDSDQYPWPVWSVVAPGSVAGSQRPETD